MLEIAGPSADPILRILRDAPNHSVVDGAIALLPKPDLIACEWTVNYGTNVGADVLRTAFACGVISECARRRGYELKLIARATAKARVTRSASGDDASVQRGLKAVLGGTGTQAKPGPLYAFRGEKESHVWAALAVAVAAGLTENEIEERRQRILETSFSRVGE